MKTKLILLLLLGWTRVVWGQQTEKADKLLPKTIADKYRNAIENTLKNTKQKIQLLYTLKL